jgi:hypothetical protein
MGRQLPTEDEHGNIVDWGDFGPGPVVEPDDNTVVLDDLSLEVLAHYIVVTQAFLPDDWPDWEDLPYLSEESFKALHSMVRAVMSNRGASFHVGRSLLDAAQYGKNNHKRWVEWQ